MRRNGDWLACLAIRRVCEAIIRRGREEGLSCAAEPPPMLDLIEQCQQLAATSPQVEPPKGQPITIRAHPQFLAYAANQGLHPAFLARVVCDDLAKRKPAKLVFNTCLPFDETVARAVAFHEAHHPPTAEDSQ